MTERQINAKYELESYLRKQREMHSLITIYENALTRTQIMGTSSCDVNVQKSRSTYPDEALSSAIMYRDRLKSKIENMDDYLRKIEIQIIKRCSPLPRQIITLRYVAGLQWPQISEQIKLTVRRCRQLESEGFEEYGSNCT